ncbi:MAG: hypothetical protein ACFFGZ_00845 [Candidatus Thorarchaeota archaeon]
MKLSKETILTFSCVIGLWIGVLLPWVEVTKTDGVDNISGFEIDGGRIVMIIATLALGVILLTRNNSFQARIAFSAGVIAGLISLAHIMYIGGLAPEDSDVLDIRIGIGLLIVLLSSIGLAIMGILAFKHLDTRERRRLDAPT